ncbi:hypothetical protein MmiEs2_14620 [Methanimicrococcus stummii]|uniref:Polymer-forming cytoskeletal protein n=1 Tax=Methanimicrococcus stummii TaxID=3028294 RepID=A0AA96VNC5_9EURY|nr:hypothetical protein [Methanimicrococcus sp. Es2]WNY29237.1 hypothetical protein MmiEs2_14620 [Methanimicrococcus sp. Es2]
MISSKNIRFHSPSNTYIIPKNSIIDQNVAVKGNVIVGSGTRFWKNIKVDGNIQFGKGCAVEGNLKAHEIIIGSRSKVKGKITADSDISLLQNAVANSVESGGNITIMPGCVVGYANGSTLSVIGKAEIKKIGVITKVTVRANTVAELEDEPEESDELENEFKNELKNEFENEFGNEFESKFENELNKESNDFISKELIFENNISDSTKKDSDESYELENDIGSDAILDSSSTPIFPMESDNENVQPDVETVEFDAEIIDETIESSPKSFTTFADLPADRPVSIPTDESSEVEIVGETSISDTDSGSDSSSEMIPRTVETPFGTVVVGEKPAKSESMNRNVKFETESFSDNQFASVTEVSKEEQQADFEAEIRAKAPPVRKSEFKWPAFEPKKMPKTIKAEVSKEPARPDNLFSNQLKSSQAQIQYDEIKIQSAPKQKEYFQSSEPNISGKANQKIVFEEIGSANSKPQQIHSPIQKSKADILMEKMNFDAVPENKKETESRQKRERTQAEIKNSKIWYEERHPQSESKKKEYPPYV